MRLITSCLCVVLLSSSDLFARPDAKEIAALLVGKWEMVSEPAPGVTKSNVEFTKDGRIIMTSGASVLYKGAFRVVDEKTLEVDLPKSSKDPKDVETTKVMIEVTKDTLTITTSDGKKVTKYQRAK